MHDRRIAGVEPAVPHGRGRRIGIVVVTLHDDVAPHDDLPQRFAVARHVSAVLVHDPHMPGSEHVHALARLDAGPFGNREV